MSEFVVKDSGDKVVFASGMQRNSEAGKTNWARVADGPMLQRWAEHLTKGQVIYPDPKPGVPNWSLAAGEEEYVRAKQSAFRHFMQWYYGADDEDHAAAVYFNINVVEYILAQKAYQVAPPDTSGNWPEPTLCDAYNLPPVDYGPSTVPVKDGSIDDQLRMVAGGYRVQAYDSTGEGELTEIEGETNEFRAVTHGWGV